MTELQIKLIESMTEISQEDYAQLEGPASYPFLRREWLLAFENGDCLGEDNGWISRHLLVLENDRPIAFMPGYIKLHSMGEFIFDQSWAAFSESRLGVPYFPKWIFAVPFTPTTGPRILLRQNLSPQMVSDLKGLVAEVIPRLTDEMGLSSAHVLFSDSWDECDSDIWLERHGVQYQFHRGATQSFDEFLSRFKSKRRNCIRRERRALSESGLRVEYKSGANLLPEDAQLAYELYKTTIDKYFYGRRYLTLDFFKEVITKMPDGLQMIVAYEGERPLAGVFNLLGKEALYGRYWGAFTEEHFLHFNLCLYEGIEFALEHQLKRMEPGAGGEHKRSRGFEPTLTRSYHYLRNPVLKTAVAEFLKEESDAISKEMSSAS